MNHASRRGLVRTAAVAVAGAGLLAGCDAAADEPASGTETPTFVLVHGSASNAFFWTPLVRHLALLGYRSLPVDLPGHGFEAALPDSYQAPQRLEEFAGADSAVAATTLDDYADRVVELVRRAHEHGPVVLVGHSLGGSTLTRVANAVPELIDRLVYVSAFCCAAVASPLELLGLPEAEADDGAATPAIDPTLPPEGVTRYNWRTAESEQLDGYRELAMHDKDREQLLTVVNYAQQPDQSVEPSLADARIDPERWGGIPRVFVRLTLDRLVPPALADRMIADADEAASEGAFEVHDIETTHLGVVYHAEELASILVGR